MLRVFTSVVMSDVYIIFRFIQLALMLSVTFKGLATTRKMFLISKIFALNGVAEGILCNSYKILIIESVFYFGMDTISLC